MPPRADAWLEKLRPADETLALPRSALGRTTTSTTPSPLRAPRSPRGPSAPRSRAETSSASSRSSLRERREEASAIVEEETGKPEELALGETDAAVEMGLFVAGRGPPLVRAHDDREHGQPDGADRPPAARRRGADHELQHAAPERRVEGVPGDLLRERRGREAVRAHACVGVVLRTSSHSRPAFPRACSTSSTGSGARRAPRSSSTTTSTS